MDDYSRNPGLMLAWGELLCREGVERISGYLWIPDRQCAILGISQKAEAELNMQALAERGVPVYRRQSGGGAVILAPTMLCFGFIAPGEWPEVAGIRESFHILTAPVRQVLQRLCGQEPEMAGISDITLLDRAGVRRKICGCAQMRKRKGVLVHGTLLVDTDLGLLAELLRWPSEVPEYRQGRAHETFCITLREASACAYSGADKASCPGAKPDTVHSPARICHEIAEAAGALGWRVLTPPSNGKTETTGSVPEEGGAMQELERLRLEKYENPEWNLLRKRPR